jgi:hypothetical protein
MIGIIVVAEDITMQRNAEKQLYSKEHFMYSVFSSIQDGISFWIEK